MLRNNSLKIYLHFDVISKYEQLEWQILSKTQSRSTFSNKTHGVLNFAAEWE